MQFCKECEHKPRTCTAFKSARTILADWILFGQTTGIKQPKLANVGRPSVIKDIQVFKIFIEKTKFSQAKDLGALFEIQFGYAISYNVILSMLHQL